ncbi:MAG: response regulator [Solirubrobacteraceae bacterium]|nr:response regulator [Patulibacter sp.]
MENAPEVWFAVVEDSDEDFALFARAFSPSGDIRRWSSGESALASFGSADPSVNECRVLIIDLHLPGMDGVEFIERARALSGGGLPTICMLSSSTDAADEARAVAAGADAFFTKPDDAQSLLALPARIAAVAAAR